MRRKGLGLWALGVGGTISLVLGCAHPAPAKPTASVQAEVNAAEAAEKQRQHEVARAHYEAAIGAAHDPASEAYARHEMAEALISWGELDKAKTQLERAVAARPGDAGSWHDLGLVRNHDGDLGGARAAFERAKQLAPDDPRPRITLAAFLWKQGDRGAAAAEYRALLELDLPDRLREKVRWALDQLK
jgi:tetratricopeptide (TPR) repeat protein